jgi:hypothetical protein
MAGRAGHGGPVTWPAWPAGGAGPAADVRGRGGASCGPAGASCGPAGASCGPAGDYCGPAGGCGAAASFQSPSGDGLTVPPDGQRRPGAQSRAVAAITRPSGLVSATG